MFIVFWLLTPYDVETPSAAYERLHEYFPLVSMEIKKMVDLFREAGKLRKAVQEVEENKDLSDSRKKKEKDRLTVRELRAAT